MAFNIHKFLKGIQIKEENTLTPKEIEITPGGSASTKTTITSSQSANRTLTLPDATTTVVGTDATQTLSNKTVDNTNAITVKDNNFTIQDDSDVTKQLQIQVSSITTGTTRTLTVPNASTTIVGTDATQTLTNKTVVVASNTITTAASGNLSSTELNAALSELQSDIDTRTSNTGVATLQNKTLDNTNTATLKDTLFTLQDDGDTSKQMQFQLSGITTATTRTLTVPNASTTIVGTDATQTLTNKTLTGNTAVNLISGSGTLTLNTTGTITVPNATDTLVGKATTDVLTNKTLTGNTAVNLISGSGTLTLNTTGTITVPNATDTLVGKATTDTLTNKTLTTPQIDIITFSDQTTPSNPSAGNHKLYIKSSGTAYILDSSGTETAIGSGGSGTLDRKTKTTTYTLTNAEDVVFLNGTFTLTIHASSGATSKAFYLNNIGTGTVTLARSSSDTIQGETAQTLAPNTSIIIIPDGSAAWYIF